MTFPATETAEMLAFLREQRKRELAADPVGYYQLMCPGGTMGDVHEMHQSHAERLNQERARRGSVGEDPYGDSGVGTQLAWSAGLFSVTEM